MSSSSKPKPPRRPYQPPKLSKVRIRLDEALLMGCKISAQMGPSGVGCTGGSGSCSSPTS